MLINYRFIFYDSKDFDISITGLIPLIEPDSDANRIKTALRNAMNSIIAEEPVPVYFHCTYGSDRTGTIAYMLEGLLGVPDEYRTREFELSTFFGIVSRNRYFSIEDVNRNQPKKWTYLTNLLPTAESIYNWFTNNGNSASDVELVTKFRAAMIN